MRKVRRAATVGEVRYDEYGQFRCMAFAEGWIMFRRFRGGTGAMTLREWNALSVVPI